MMNKEERIALFKKFMSKGMSEQEVEVLAIELDEIGFFDAPASTVYHGNYPGGLFDHCFIVAKSLVSLTKKLDLNWQHKRSPYLVGMLHDLCKCDSYILKEDGTYEYNKTVELNGHGDKSVIIAQKFFDLTEEEILCIRWHMGAFDDKQNWNCYGASIEKYPNVLFTHTADMIAARIMNV